MQPLKVIVMPRWVSTKGCEAASLRSMILRRRCPNPTCPRKTSPPPSGPRGAMASAIFSIIAAEAIAPGLKRTSPQMPHMGLRSLHWFTWFTRTIHAIMVWFHSRPRIGERAARILHNGDRADARGRLSRGRGQFMMRAPVQPAGVASDGEGHECERASELLVRL